MIPYVWGSSGTDYQSNRNRIAICGPSKPKKSRKKAKFSTFSANNFRLRHTHTHRGMCTCCPEHREALASSIILNGPRLRPVDFKNRRFFPKKAKKIWFRRSTDRNPAPIGLIIGPTASPCIDEHWHIS